MAFEEHEAQTAFTRFVRSESGVLWLRALAGLIKDSKLEVYPISGFAFELKVDGGRGRIPFSHIEEHQVTSLIKAGRGVLSHKISDSAIGFKPCDMVVIMGGVACFIFAYGKRLNGARWYAIDVDVLWRYMSERGRGSFSEDWAREYGHEILGVS